MSSLDSRVPWELFGIGNETFDVLVVLYLLAFALHTVCELTESVWQGTRRRIGLRKRLFDQMRILTEYRVFPSWHAFMALIATGYGNLSRCGRCFSRDWARSGFP